MVRRALLLCLAPLALTAGSEESLDARELVLRAEDALRGETAEMRAAMTITGLAERLRIGLGDKVVMHMPGETGLEPAEPGARMRGRPERGLRPRPDLQPSLRSGDLAGCSALRRER